MVLLGVRGEDKWSVMGRETFLAPVDWSGIWPVVNPSHPGRVDFQVELPHSGPPSGMREKQGFRDDFHSGKLSPEWTTIRTPLESWWSFPKKPPSLRILLRPDQLWQDLQPSFLGIRITGPNCSASVRMEFDPKESGECSGLAILRSSSACWMLVIEQGDPGMQKLRASVYEGEKFLGSLPVDSPSVELRISLDFPRLSFDVRERSSAPWQTVATCDATALAKDPGGRFTGSFLGLYASSRGKPSSNRADFRLFDYTCIP
jgi:alpha-N-arabinofuranosidase